MPPGAPPRVEPRRAGVVSVGLPRHYGVTRMTVLQALRLFRDGVLSEPLDRVTLTEFGLAPKTSMQVRVHSLTPLFKLYVINGVDVFFGFYPIQERTRTFDGEEVAYDDLAGKDAPRMANEGAGPDAPGAQEVTAARQWFDSAWATISRERSR